MTPSETVGVDHAQRIFPAVESRDLQDEGSPAIDAEVLDRAAADLERNLHVPRAERIDGRRNELEETDSQVAGNELFHREDGPVVLLDERLEERPDLRIGRRAVDVAPPHPPLVMTTAETAHRSRLGIVDEVDVVLTRQRVCAGPRVFEVAGRPVGPQAESRALKGVVKRLGDGEKLVIGPNHLPVDRQPEGLEQRNLTRQDLRDPAARRRGVDVTDAYALKRAGELLQLGDQLVVYEGTVGRE